MRTVAQCVLNSKAAERFWLTLTEVRFTAAFVDQLHHGKLPSDKSSLVLNVAVLCVGSRWSAPRHPCPWLLSPLFPLCRPD